MSRRAESLVSALTARFADTLQSCVHAHDEVTIEVARADLLGVCRALRDEPEFSFEQLSDLCGVDYATYGQTEWATEDASGSGFSRGVEAREAGRMGVVLSDAAEVTENTGRRFAAVHHILSMKHNLRLRIRCFAEDDGFPVVDSVCAIWNSANWYEREAFDLFGIMFEGHPDLRRILTDYGFVGHPFRKDFPLSGNVEMRYDPEKGRVVYQPVSIEPRVLVPRVIRHDQRYAGKAGEEAGNA